MEMGKKERKRKRGPGHFLHPVQYELHVSASEWNRINSARFPSAAKRVEHTHKQARETSVTRDCHLFLNFDFYSKTALCIIWQCNFRASSISTLATVEKSLENEQQGGPGASALTHTYCFSACTEKKKKYSSRASAHLDTSVLNLVKQFLASQWLLTPFKTQGLKNILFFSPEEIYHIHHSARDMTYPYSFIVFFVFFWRYRPVNHMVCLLVTPQRREARRLIYHTACAHVTSR